jgi:phosphate transport system ATP-binding protein
MSSAIRVRPVPSAPPLLRSESLGVRYGNKPALAGVSLEIPAQQITALIGPSGCGKTSFLCALNRMAELVPSCRVSGRVWIGERDVYAPDVELAELRRRVGMIFQKPNPFPLSIRRNIELPLLERRRIPRAERDAIVEDVLTRVGLWKEVRDRLDRSALALSGGQQQRLCLARALALEPEAILLDEPCSALDPLSSAVVEDLVAGLRSRCTVVIVTHNLAQARRVADRTALFWTLEGVGTLVESGPTEQIFTSPRHELTAEYVRGTRG